MIFFGWARNPLRLIVTLAIAYALAHFVLAPARVPVSDQLSITFLTTLTVNAVINGVIRRERRRRDPRTVKSHRGLGGKPYEGP